TKATPARYPDSAYMAPLKIRRASDRGPCRLSTDTAPTSAAPNGPTSTTAARLAAVLGDHEDCRAAIRAGGESQTRNSNCKTIRAAQKRAGRSRGMLRVTSAAAAPTTRAV